MSRWSQEHFLAAWHFAADAHGDQKVPGSERPYLTHVGAVAMEVMALIAGDHPPDDPDLALQCALLHDVLEDTDTDEATLRARFGHAVTDGVLALTKDKSLPDKRAQMADSLARIRAQPPEIAIVKMADRITNLQPPPAHWDAAKSAAYRAEAQRIHDALSDASPTLAARLAEKIAAYRGG